MATKEQIIAQRTFATERYILSTMPVMYLPLPRLAGSTFTSRDGHGILCTPSVAVETPEGWSFGGVDAVINCGDDTILDFTTACTLAAWVKPGAIGATQHIIGRDNGTQRNYILLIASTNVVSFQNWVATVNATCAGATAVAVGNWYFIAGTYDNLNLNVYFNGIVDAAPVAQTGTMDNGNVSMTIGLRADNIRDYTGIIGDVLAYNRALSPSEIQNVYLATKWRYS